MKKRKKTPLSRCVLSDTAIVRDEQREREIIAKGADFLWHCDYNGEYVYWNFFFKIE